MPPAVEPVPSVELPAVEPMLPAVDPPVVVEPSIVPPAESVDIISASDDAPVPLSVEVPPLLPLSQAPRERVAVRNRAVKTLIRSFFIMKQREDVGYGSKTENKIGFSSYTGIIERIAKK